jgi:hypothetical protein
VERTLDLHAKIAASSPEHRERIERSLFADAEYPGCLVRPPRLQKRAFSHSTLL